MKVISKKSVAIFAVVTALFSLQISAQTVKPKGQPWPAPDEFVKMKNPITVDDSTLATGKDLYSQHCKSCHGVKGKGDGTKAEKIEIQCGDFTSPEYAKTSDGDAYWKTTEGRKPMPSFKEKLSDKERWTVIYYVRSLGKAK
jgi:mono/diheme cytochrome c family protein